MSDVTGAVIEVIVKESAKRLFSLLESALLTSALRKEVLEAKVEFHLRYVLSWASQVQHYGMAESKDVEVATIGLSLAAGARRFRPRSQTPDVLTEESLLADGRSYILLGDPGSGKTTTLKRLARQLLLTGSSTVSELFQFPLVIEAKTLGKRRDLEIAIADALGVSLQIPSAPQPEDLIAEQGKKKRPEKLIGSQKAIEAIATLLDAAKCILLVDGIDECPPSERDQLDKDISKLAFLLSRAKVIASCRTGDYATQIDGFSLVEILPLTKPEIDEISRVWLKNRSGVFLDELRRKTYVDLADRPLFLVNLMLVYSMAGYLPPKGIDVYRRMIALLLERWDEQRGVKRRKTRYSHFLPEGKIDFLSELAWELTYEYASHTFSTSKLEAAYRKIAGRFDLPAAEATDVAHEIESHTGIVVATGFEEYQFCHLTLREYLSANFIVREPYIRDFQSSFTNSPAPFALAVALSSKPETWFAHLVLRYMMRTASDSWANGVYVLLDRLKLERVRFGHSELFGLAIMVLESSCNLGGASHRQVSETFDSFVEFADCLPSLRKAIQKYTPANPKFRNVPYLVEIKLESAGQFDGYYPDGLVQPTRLVLRRTFAESLLGYPV